MLLFLMRLYPAIHRKIYYNLYSRPAPAFAFKCPAQKPSTYLRQDSPRLGLQPNCCASYWINLIGLLIHLSSRHGTIPWYIGIDLRQKKTKLTRLNKDAYIYPVKSALFALHGWIGHPLRRKKFPGVGVVRIRTVARRICYPVIPFHF